MSASFFSSYPYLNLILTCQTLQPMYKIFIFAMIIKKNIKKIIDYEENFTRIGLIADDYGCICR